jgi:hypothetical protein
LESPETVVALVTGKPTEIEPVEAVAAPVEVEKAKK